MDDIQQAIEQLSVDEYVGFWERLLASLVDTLALAVVTIPMLLVIYGMPALQGSGQQPVVLGFWDVVINYIFPTVAVLLFWHYFAATPGKMLFNARIADAETLVDPSTRQLIIRYLCYYVSMLPLGLGFFWIGFDKRKQGWHDKLAKTVVVRNRD